MQVDLGSVAQSMGYTNVASVGNRFRLLRKRYNLRLECKNTGNTNRSKGTSCGPVKSKDISDSSSDPADDTPMSPKKPRGRKLDSKPIPASGPDGGSEVIAARKAKSNRNRKGVAPLQPKATSDEAGADSQSRGEISPALLYAIDVATAEEEAKEAKDESTSEAE